MILTNQLKKDIRSLHRAKYRQKYNKFIAEGPKICHEFLESREFKIDIIVCTQNYLENNDTNTWPEDAKLYITSEKRPSIYFGINSR